MRLLLLNIKLYIGITEAITKLSTAALVGTPAAPIQHIAEILVRERVTLPCPVGARLLLGRRVEPLIDIVPGGRGIAQREAFGHKAAAATAGSCP